MLTEQYVSYWSKIITNMIPGFGLWMYHFCATLALRRGLISLIIYINKQRRNPFLQSYFIGVHRSIGQSLSLDSMHLLAQIIFIYPEIQGHMCLFELGIVDFKITSWKKKHFHTPECNHPQARLLKSNNLLPPACTLLRCAGCFS